MVVICPPTLSVYRRPYFTHTSVYPRMAHFCPSHIYLYTFSMDTNQVSSLYLSLLSGADCKQQIINIMGSF